MAKLKILYFAWVAEKIGRADEEISLPEDVSCVGELIAWLRALDAGYAAAFINPRLVRAAVNHVFAAPDTPVAGGDEVAFFPPVTGG